MSVPPTELPADLQGAPESSPEEVERRRTRSTLAIATAILVVLTAALALVPVPYVALSPGQTINTLGSVDGTPLITISGRATYPSTGHLNLTTVGVTGGDARLDLMGALAAWVDPRRAVVPRDQIYPENQTPAESRQRNAEEMTLSQVHAINAARNQLGIKPVGSEVAIAAISVGAPALGKLKAGDVVLAVDGRSVATPDDMRRLVSAHKVGTAVRVRVRRAGAVRTEVVTTGPAPDDATRAIIGVSPIQSARYPFDVRIALDDVGGPSAGLMFALGVVEKLTPEEITGGLFIAGTGTIDDTGKVGPIGGIQQKLLGARDAGATVFLVPADDCAEAVPARPAGLRLVRVTSLTTALSALESLRDGKNDAVPTCPG